MRRQIRVMNGSIRRGIGSDCGFWRGHNVAYIGDRQAGRFEVVLGYTYPELILSCENISLLLCRQYVVVPLRVNVNLKAVTVEDLIARRKVLQLYCNT
jgi:hypothetical protein